MFFVDRRRLPNYPLLAEEFGRAGEHPPLAFVHPETYLRQFDLMTQKIRESVGLAMRDVARLRDINLVAFPDWNQPLETVAAQLSDLLRALLLHPDRRRITLVVNVAGPREPQAAEVLAQLVAQYINAKQRAAADNPEVSAIGRSFGPEQWEVLMSCVQWRVTLARRPGGDRDRQGATVPRRFDGSDPCRTAARRTVIGPLQCGPTVGRVRQLDPRRGTPHTGDQKTGV